MQKIWVSWSTGKDSAWTLQRLRQEDNYQVTGLLTTVTSPFRRVSMHGVRADLLRQQAQALNLPLYVANLPWPCPNSTYDQVMNDICSKALEMGVSAIAFGDLFLEDVRSYREEKMSQIGLEAIFPLWESSTKQLIHEMIDCGLKATITCIDSERLSSSILGSTLDHALIRSLGDGVDPCGENGEFHSFVWDGPMFSRAIRIKAGDYHQDGRFIFRDLINIPPDTSIGLPECVSFH